MSDAVDQRYEFSAFIMSTAGEPGVRLEAELNRRGAQGFHRPAITLLPVAPGQSILIVAMERPV